MLCVWLFVSPSHLLCRITFTASIAVALCCGLTYAFSIWSGALKNAYNLNQSQLELVAAAANVGGYRWAVQEGTLCPATATLLATGTPSPVLCCPLPSHHPPTSSGIFSGLVYDALEKHKKFGPRAVLALGLLANAGGYLGLWAAVTG